MARSKLAGSKSNLLLFFQPEIFRSILIGNVNRSDAQENTYITSSEISFKIPKNCLALLWGKMLLYLGPKNLK